MLLLTILLSNISKMNKAMLSESAIHLTPDYIETETSFAHSEVKWTAVQKLARTHSYIYIYLMQHGAIMIPRRVFENDEAWEGFWRMCQESTRAD